MTKKKYAVVDKSEVPQRQTGQYKDLWLAVKDLAPGKAIKYQCSSEQEMRRVIVSIQSYYGKRENIPISVNRDTASLTVYFSKR